MVSVILVNYRTARLLIGAISSVLSQQDIEKPEIIVVDNSASDSEAALLKEQLPAEVNYIQNEENIGFARACNQAFARSSGEFILLLNPDARLLPLALSRLVRTIKNCPDAGAVGPRVYWDDACQFLLPPSTFPSYASLYGQLMAHLHPVMARRQTLQFRKLALRLWTSKKIMQVEALSGGHVLLRRDALLKAGGLFDERFFLYWEDTDLMQRLRKAGYRLYVDPNAGCLHYYEHTPNKDRLIEQGWSVYKTKHFQRKLRFRFATWFQTYLPPVALPHFKSLQPDDTTLFFPVCAALTKAWLLELSPSPHFIPAVGLFGSGPIAKVDSLYWSRLHEKIYFARLSAPVSNPDLILHWQWQGRTN